MKPFAMAALLLLLLFVSAQGFRLEKGFLKSVDPDDECSSTRKSYGGAVGYDLSEDKHCSGKSRKLVTENGGRRKEERSKEGCGKEESLISQSWPETSAGNGQPEPEASHDHYLDTVEITEMDYSPARRKPPIHN